MNQTLVAVLSLLHADAPEQITGAPQDWPRWAVLLPHVLAATSHFDTGTQDADEADAAWLLDRAAVYLRVHARPGRAAEAAERRPQHLTCGGPRAATDLRLLRYCRGAPVPSPGN